MLRNLVVVILLVCSLGTEELRASSGDTIPCDETVRVRKTYCPNCEAWGDLFSPDFTGKLPSDYQLLVFDTNGIVVFSSDSIEKGWDGQVKETELQMMSFRWEMNYRYEKDGPLYSCSGMVALIQ